MKEPSRSHEGAITCAECVEPTKWTTRGVVVSIRSSSAPTTARSSGASRQPSPAPAATRQLPAGTSEGSGCAILAYLIREAIRLMRGAIRLMRGQSD